jgi:hypothetical protein
VLYQQTPLAASVVEACRREPDPADPETTYVTI